MTHVEAGAKHLFPFFFSLLYSPERSHLGEGLNQPHDSFGLWPLQGCITMLPNAIIFVRWVHLLAANQNFLNFIHAALERNQ